MYLLTASLLLIVHDEAPRNSRNIGTRFLSHIERRPPFRYVHSIIYNKNITSTDFRCRSAWRLLNIDNLKKSFSNKITVLSLATLVTVMTRKIPLHNLKNANQKFTVDTPIIMIFQQSSEICHFFKWRTKIDWHFYDIVMTIHTFSGCLQDMKVRKVMARNEFDLLEHFPYSSGWSDPFETVMVAIKEHVPNSSDILHACVGINGDHN